MDKCNVKLLIVATVLFVGSGYGALSLYNFTRLVPDFSSQSLQVLDDSADGDDTLEEVPWKNTTGEAATGIWKDSRAGLYWSAVQGAQSNHFTKSGCDFFSTTPRGNYTGSDVACGNAINYCAGLSLDSDADGSAEADWYLPSQKELMQAYIDGVYNSDSAFATGSFFWSSTQSSEDPASAWSFSLNDGLSLPLAKTEDKGTYVRCVRRD